MPNRPCWVEIDTHALEHNYRLLAATTPVPLLAIVKADAYGHSLALCAPAVVRTGARWLGVTSVEEGIAARSLCAHPDILVISGPFPGQGPAVLENRLTPVVWTPAHLDELESAAHAVSAAPQSIPVHLELDTGMSRQGVQPAHLAPLLAGFTPTSPLRLTGLMTHLYAADESDGQATAAQFTQLASMLETIRSAGLPPAFQPKLLHVGNSAALLAGDVPAALAALCARHNLQPMLRPGLALYGLAPAFEPNDPPAVTTLRSQLQPVLSWKTRIVDTRTLTPGQLVGYNGTFIATEPMRVALLAVGYADGLRRSLGNTGPSGNGYVLIQGQRAPIIGRISMDQTVVDITEIPAAATSDEVVLIGKQGREAISAEHHARWASTIPWEILTSITTRVPRQGI